MQAELIEYQPLAHMSAFCPGACPGFVRVKKLLSGYE